MLASVILFVVSQIWVNCAAEKASINRLSSLLLVGFRQRVGYPPTQFVPLPLCAVQVKSDRFIRNLEAPLWPPSGPHHPGSVASHC